MSAPSLAFPRWDFVEGMVQGVRWSVRWDRQAIRDGRQPMIYYGFDAVRMGTKLVDVAIRNVPRDREWQTGVRLDVDLEHDGLLFGSLPPNHVGCVFGRRDQQTVILLFGWDADVNVPIIRCYDRCSFDKDCAEVLPRHQLAVKIVEDQPVITMYSGWDVHLADDRTLWHNLPAGDVAAMQALTHLLWHAPKQEWWNIGWLYRSPITAFRDFYTAWSSRHLARWSMVVSRPSFVRCAP